MTNQPTPIRRQRPGMDEADVRRVLRLAGLPEFHNTARPEGGYELRRHGNWDQIRIEWRTEADFNAVSGERESENRHDRLARVERGMTSAMTRAIAEVLNVAGYTVAVAPEIISMAPDASDGQDPHLIVMAPPKDLSWSTASP